MHIVQKAGKQQHMVYGCEILGFQWPCYLCKIHSNIKSGGCCYTSFLVPATLPFLYLLHFLSCTLYCYVLTEKFRSTKITNQTALYYNHLHTHIPITPRMHTYIPLSTHAHIPHMPCHAHIPCM